MLRLQEHQRTRLFVRRDRFDRFVSCLVFVPRDKYNTDLRRRIANLLIEAFNGASVEFTPLAVGVDRSRAFTSSCMPNRARCRTWTRANSKRGSCR